MNKCNNCAKFLTCDRRKCNQVTFLQVGQIDKIEPELLETLANTLGKDIDYIRYSICQFGMNLKEAIEEDKKKFIEALKKGGNK